MKFLIRRQLSIALRDEPGQLARACQLLAEHVINIDALQVTAEDGAALPRVLTSNASLARDVLARHGFAVGEAEVLEVEMRNEPGALQFVAHALAAQGINIDSAYGTEAASGDSMRVCLKLSDPLAAARALRSLPAPARA